MSAHQVEGNNINSDWWQWEQEKVVGRQYPVEPSGVACDFYHRYEEDFELCRKLNNNAIRFSIEWARIQPGSDTFDQAAIDHYKKILTAARKRGLKTFVTLHHFTNPVWFARQGGWRNANVINVFGRYARRCAVEFGSLVDAFITINEPQVYALMAFLAGLWPPNQKSPLSSFQVQFNMAAAHRHAYDRIKEVTETPVGLAKNIVWYETDPYRHRVHDRIAAGLLNFLETDFYLRPIAKKLDFIGLNFYFTHRIRNFRFHDPTDYVSDLGWWVHPGGLGTILKNLKKYHLPIYVTENGVADGHDILRAHFIRDMVIACGAAIHEENVDLRGYFHWSLLDNYEWHHGYGPKFGLVEVDRERDLDRKPRRSFEYYAEICRENRIVVEE